MRKVILLLGLAAQVGWGAATLVIQSVVANTDGTVTLTFNGTSPLSPSSGVTDITIHSGAGFTTLTTEATAVSGLTVTVTTYGAGTTSFPIMGDTSIANIWATITTGSNLQDASGNTVSSSASNTNQTATANNSTWMSCKGSLLAPSVRLDGSPIGTNEGGGMEACQWMSSDGCVRFNATITGFNMIAFDIYSAVALLQDGVQVGSTNWAGSDSGWTEVSFAGLSGAHLYETCEVGPNVGAPYPFIGAIQIVGGTGFGSQPAVKPFIIFFGASEAECEGFGVGGNAPYTMTDTQSCAWWILARAAGFSDQHVGSGGWPVTTNTACIGVGCTIHNYTGTTLMECAAGTPPTCDTSNWPLGSQAPTYVWVDNGGNDAIVDTIIGTGYVTAGTFNGDSVTMFGNLISRWAPTGGIFAFDEYYAPSIGGTPCSSGAIQLPWITAFQGAGHYYATNTPAVKVNFVPEFAATCALSGEFQSDGLHLAPAGQAGWAAILLPYLQNAGAVAGGFLSF